nr:uncharacterized protein LOC111421939 [Onthophagus taurus]
MDVLPDNSSVILQDLQQQEYKIWTVNSTKLMIDLYKKYRHKVGGIEIRNLKKMWELIAEELNKNYKLNVSANNCDNRWRVLERNYKKCIDNAHKTDRGRKCFEFETEMNEVFGKKKNIIPKSCYPVTQNHIHHKPVTKSLNNHLKM